MTAAVASSRESDLSQLAASDVIRNMQSCGAEVAESALVPEQIAALLLHVSQNLDAHAEWVGTSSEPARLEHEGMRALAAHYRAIASAAARAAEHMRSLHALAPAPHDPAGWDGPSFVAWMRRKIELQRGLAALLQQHAARAEAALAKEFATYSEA